MVRYPFCSSPCILANEVQLFSDLGLYSGIFAMYLQLECQPNKSTSRTATIIFYAICLLFVLSTVDFVSDLAAPILVEVSNNLSVVRISFFLSVAQSRVLISVEIVQTIASGCCDFVAQCILVRIKHCTYHPFYSLNLQRSTVVGSSGVIISVW